ncbi:light-harvesting complex-like protein 3 isotype 1, chloroplastic [Telopea speciosissima]|uniref:light-harvesting complex-like protein 3 isotype 1, chloroplastic n=1 Tax=Telopea speciosissima TaxID=54955 RepID=UPI001CC3FBD0|nr:light-harvesting complex-like protein 3 isotype 1, chloroplastic [Telopea speciosissima]
MASIAISVSLQEACNSHHIIKKQLFQMRPRCSFGVQQAAHVVNKDLELKKGGVLEIAEPGKAIVGDNSRKGVQSESVQGMEAVSSVTQFYDERWKNGTRDLNMFVKDEARRRKFLELYPEAATTKAPVLFMSSIIPWWAWLKRSHLPEAELLNGRAAMVGFFMAYLVDGLTGLDVIGQTGNFICKAGLFITVVGIILFRKTRDFGNLQKLVDEATFYDKQWQATWQDKRASNSSSESSDQDQITN